MASRMGSRQGWADKSGGSGGADPSGPSNGSISTTDPILSQSMSGAQERGAPVEPSAEPGEGDERSLLHAARLARLVQRDWNRGGSGVSVPLDVVEDLLVRQPERFLHGLVDAEVGLVRDEEVDLRDGDPLLLAQLADGL